MNLQAQNTPQAFGIYVHVPFCASTCDFCGFYQKKPHDDDYGRFLEGIRLELEAQPALPETATIFWGGGTPGLLGPRELERLGALLLERLPAPPAEWSVEMAPAFVTDRKLAVLRELGVNRISMGVQSFQEPLLEQLGRQHTLRQVHAAIDRVRRAGFDNLNLDLIFAIPGQDWKTLRRDLDAAVAAEPAHISTYCLTFEEDTALYLKLAQGRLRIDSDHEAGLYARTWEHLEGAGFAQYEVSNFSRPGYACLHNLNTWRMESWLGFGPAASSQWSGRRWTNVPDFDRWLAGLRAGSPEMVDAMELTGEVLAVDALIFGMRMTAGVDLRAWARRFGQDPEKLRPLLESWGALGFIASDYDHDRLQLTLRGRLLADRLAGELLDFFDAPSGGGVHLAPDPAAGTPAGG